jgi:hypothetical protein
VNAGLVGIFTILHFLCKSQRITLHKAVKSLQGTNTSLLIEEWVTARYILPLSMKQIKIIHKLLHFYIFEKLFVGILKLSNEQHNCFTSYSNEEQPKAMRMYAATLTTPSMKLLL